MIEFTIETEISRPPAEVFAFVTDPEKLPRWQTNTVSVEQEGEGPLEVGTRLREVHRAPGGRELASVVEVSELEADRVFALKAVEAPLPLNARIELEPTDTGTRMLFAVHGRPSGLMRVAQPLARAALRRQFERHCENLKSELEAQQLLPPTDAG
jgi:uncharacterized protein YndB with AHSA1/START domain